MTVEQLLAHMGGYILSNKARVTVDGKEVVVGRFEGSELVFTEAGRALATQPPVMEPVAIADTVKVEDTPTPKRTRKTVEPSVESGLNTLSTEENQ